MSNEWYTPRGNDPAAERDLLIALHETPGIGRGTIRRLLEAMPAGFAAAGLSRKRADELRAIGISPAKATAIASSLAARPRHSRNGLDNGSGKGRGTGSRAGGNYRIVTIWDGDYPPLLRETTDPPLVLYVRGELDALRLPAIAVVGTRVPTAYGRRMAGEMAERIAATGLGVTSGLARGIDAAAHEGALHGGGITIAVMATSIDRIYPPEHVRLAARIVDSGGALVSEYPPGTPPHPGLFPERNRLIAGLTLGTLVVEAAEKSGAMITADHALADSREVFAVPGPVSSPKSAGPHMLLRIGAKLVAGLPDIVEELRRGPLVWAIQQLQTLTAASMQQTADSADPTANLAASATGSARPPAGVPDPFIDSADPTANFAAPATGSARPPAAKPARAASSGFVELPQLTGDEAKILEFVGFEPVSFDRILEWTRFDFGHLHVVLLSLTMKKVLLTLPGPSYIRAT